MNCNRMRVGAVLAILGLPIFGMHSRMRDSCSAQAWLHSDDESDLHPGNDDDSVSLLQNLKEPLKMFPRGPDSVRTKEFSQQLIHSNISELSQDDQMSSLANVERAIQFLGQSSVVALNLTQPLLLQKSNEIDAVRIASDTSAQEAQTKSQSGHFVAYAMVMVVCFIVVVLFLTCVFFQRGRHNTAAASSLLKGTESQGGSRQASIPPSTNAIAKVTSPRSPNVAYVSQLPGSSTLPPPSRAAPSHITMSETTFDVPLADFLELTYLSTGYFNVVDSQQTVFHAEVRVTPSGRLLEVSQVYAPGNSLVLVSVGEPNAALPPSHLPPRSAQMHGLPADVLEVRTRDGRIHSTIESYSRGSYQIMQDGRKAFIIDGSPVELEINVTSATSGRPVARMQRTGAYADQALAVLELSVAPGVAGADPLPILAILLAIVVLRAWPMKVEEATQAASRAASALSLAATQSLQPLQQRATPSLLGLNFR